MHRPTLSRPRTVALAAIAVLASTLLPGSRAVADADEVTLRTVAAMDTDPAIDDPGIGDHVIGVPAGNALGKLVMFFPGTRARPDQYSLLLRRSAELGYHTVGLAYMNYESVNFDLCPQGPARDSSPDCGEQVRTEILTGEDTSDKVDVSPANSAFNRLVKVLQYLDTHFPAEGWGAYLDGAAPRWDLIATMGQSQGGGHAAFTAKLHEVERAVLFSATEPAEWTLKPGATPPARYFGLVHRFEPISVGIMRSWDNLEMTGPDVYIDVAPAPNYGGSHRLVTTRVDCTGDPAAFGYFHNCASVDEWMPLNPDGTSAYQPVWDYLLLQDPDAPA